MVLQNLIAVTIVLGCCAWLVRHFLSAWSGSSSSGCHGCTGGGCASEVAWHAADTGGPVGARIPVSSVLQIGPAAGTGQAAPLGD